MPRRVLDGRELGGDDGTVASLDVEERGGLLWALFEGVGTLAGFELDALADPFDTLVGSEPGDCCSLRLDATG